MERTDIEQKITKAINDIASKEQIENYLNDIDAFGDINLYIDMEDQEIFFDFKDWENDDSYEL
jgi:hypothetical protein